VPEALTQKLDPQRVAMRGTDAAQPQCIALEGTIGHATRCSVYARRPSPCRELQAAWEDGQPSAKCDRARVRHGLSPLQREDWIDAPGVHGSPALHG
jgi:Fe-S-cluster containining protein